MRRELGVEAFGINWFELPPGAEGVEHDETATGQEEVNVVIAGSGVWRIDGDGGAGARRHLPPLRPGDRPLPVAGPDGMTFIGVGARRGSYEAHGPF